MLHVEPVKADFVLGDLTGFLDVRFMYFALRETEKSKGFFSRVVGENEWVERPMEMQLIFDFPIGAIHWFHLDADTVASGQSFFSSDPNKSSNSVNIGTFLMKALARFETVNAHQWEGVTPVSSVIDYKDGKSHKKEEERALWDVATFDQVSGQRLLLARTHARRDNVFQFQNNVQQIMDWAVSIINQCPPDEHKPDHYDEEALAEILAETTPPNNAITS